MAELQRGPSRVWIQPRDALGSNPSSATRPAKLGVTPSLPRACWTELRLPGGHWDHPVATGCGASIVKCEISPVWGGKGWWARERCLGPVDRCSGWAGAQGGGYKSLQPRHLNVLPAALWSGPEPGGTSPWSMATHPLRARAAKFSELSELESLWMVARGHARSLETPTG